MLRIGYSIVFVFILSVGWNNSLGVENLWPGESRFAEAVSIPQVDPVPDPIQQSDSEEVWEHIPNLFEESAETNGADGFSVAVLPILRFLLGIDN